MFPFTAFDVSPRGQYNFSEVFTDDVVGMQIGFNLVGPRPPLKYIEHILVCLVTFKDVRANCFCASLLRTTARANSHATSCIERARQALK